MVHKPDFRTEVRLVGLAGEGNRVGYFYRVCQIYEMHDETSEPEQLCRYRWDLFAKVRFDFLPISLEM